MSPLGSHACIKIYHLRFNGTFRWLYSFKMFSMHLVLLSECSCSVLWKIWMRIIIVRVASYDDVTTEKIGTIGNISSKVWQKLQGNQSENSNLFKQYCSCSSISQSCPFSLSFERKGMNFTSRNLNASHPFVNSVWIPGISCLFTFVLTKGRNRDLGKVSSIGVRFDDISWFLIRRSWYIFKRVYLLIPCQGCVLDRHSQGQLWLDQT